VSIYEPHVCGVQLDDVSQATYAGAARAFIQPYRLVGSKSYWMGAVAYLRGRRPGIWKQLQWKRQTSRLNIAIPYQ
jgi:hypothetical protein